MALDVTDATSLVALTETLNDVPIDMLVNNGGIMGHNAGSFAETDFAQIDQTFAVNTPTRCG